VNDPTISRENLRVFGAVYVVLEFKLEFRLDYQSCDVSIQTFVRLSESPIGE